MDRVDDMSQDIVKYNTYSRNLSKQQQQKHQVTLTHTHKQALMFLRAHSTHRHSEQAAVETSAYQHAYKG